MTVIRNELRAETYAKLGWSGMMWDIWGGVGGSPGSEKQNLPRRRGDAENSQDREGKNL
jgi:hypothetical protein